MPRRKIDFRPGNYYHCYNLALHCVRAFPYAHDYMKCLELTSKYIEKCNITVVAYCLMPNHYHFLLRQNGGKSISLFIQCLFDAYVQYFNKRNNRRGPLFIGRFDASLVDTNEYMMHVCRYIHINPVIADLVTKAEDWPFSNYLEWLGRRDGHLVDRDFITQYFQTPEQYRDFVQSYLGEVRPPGSIA
ncbi:transposase [candidate division KSB1 bacterium]|nr:transposase [candidate division KSB1 bacterium]